MSEPLEQMFNDRLTQEAMPVFNPRDWTRRYNETSVEMESRPVRWDDRFGNGGKVIPTHPWEVIRFIEDDTIKLFVRSGRVITAAATFEGPPFPGAVFTLNNPNTVVYLKFTYAAGLTELLNIKVKAEEGLPADTDTEQHWIIAEVDVKLNSRGDLIIEAITQRLFEDVRLKDGGIGGELHQWKVTADPVEIDIPPTISVVGGTINTQDTFEDFFVADEVLTAISGEVTLKIVRASATRAIESAVIEIHPTDSFPESDYYNQYVTLAVVNFNEVTNTVTSILQTKFEDIQIFEDLAVVNGELRLVPLAMHGRTHYAIPAP